MVLEKLHYLPILITIWFPMTFIITYIVAVSRDDVSALFPYISDTGTYAPESCIFGQMLNLGAIIVALTAYIRYIQLKELCENNDIHYKVEKLNWASCIAGLLSALGISIVGNFQEMNLISMHLIGALLGFGVGAAYMIIQTYIGFKIRKILGSGTLNWIRVVLLVGIVITFFLVFIFAILGGLVSGKKALRPKWNSDEAGWIWHFLSTVSEWILSFCLMLALSTFAYDFKRIRLTLPTVTSNFR